jgi:murein DD-endopeptidase MepM/ murein hydrolase activator NlpD
MMRILVYLLALLGMLFMAVTVQAGLPGGPLGAPFPPTPTPEEPGSEAEGQVEQAVLAAAESQREQVLGLLVNDVQVESIQLSADQTQAAAWLVMVDPESGSPLPAEPGLALARLTGEGWQVTLPADPGWADLLKSAPPEMLSDEVKSAWLDMLQVEGADQLAAPIGGYLLPWAAGETVWLSQSVLHDKYIPSGSAHFAFDFYVPNTMFRLYASRPGIVWRARWDVPNFDASGVGNYLVLQDNTTNPVTYQLYLHLAKDSIPAALRQQGATVVQGQYIGLADDTGQSSGHHLHFQVHTNPASYWGTAVDFTFADVDINGGRPRVDGPYYSDKPYCKSTDVCNSFRSAYVSGNQVAGDIVPPTGGLLAPTTGDRIQAQQLNIEAWASDEGSGLDKARLLAYYNNSWKEIGGEFSTNLFSLEWDMCAAGVPDGPVSLAVQAWDKEGNPSFGLPGLTHFTKDYPCAPPPPACIPSADQAALFAGADFTGTCTLLGAGEYPNSASFGALGDDNVASVQVGSNVLATLYTDANYAGRGTTLASNDANLADDPVGADRGTSLRVRARSDPPRTPEFLVAPASGATYPAGSTVTFSWRDPGGASEFQAQLFKDGTALKTSAWLADPYWQPQNLSLAAGSYTWRVRARNCMEDPCQTAWSATSAFSITAGSPPGTTVTAPFLDTVEGGTNGWTGNGLWNRLNDSSRSHAGTYSWYYGISSSWDYKNGSPNSGDLTSRPVAIPGTGYALRFWYRAATESPERHWDQRWAQISVDGGPFNDVLQLYDDATAYWLNATVDLSAYAGKTIRVRFHFAALDGAFNAYEGWFIDDIEISTLEIPSCNDQDNTTANALLLAYGQSTNQVLCPSGDVDYFRFEGSAGDRIVADVDSNPDSPPDDLDLVLFLLDGDGASVLSSHDDEVAGKAPDPRLGYTLRRTGSYYLKARSWSHPSAGGLAHTYSLRLLKDSQAPSASFASPASGGFLSNLVLLNVSASDSGSGVSRVLFTYHGPDWMGDPWETLGTDFDGSDGWSFPFDASTLPEQPGLAFYAHVFDWAGNWTGAAAWNLAIDRTPPVTSLQPLTGTPDTTALLLQWTASDNLSGLGSFDLQYKPGASPWTDHAPDPPGSDTQAWFVGDAGQVYGFRMRGTDQAGNLESYPSQAETGAAIPPAGALCSVLDPREGSTGDNMPGTAQAVQVGSPPQTHNFCNPLAANRLNDEDWVRFTVQTGQMYILRAEPLHASVGAVLELYAADGTTSLAQGSAAGFGKSAQIKWISDRQGQVYLRVRHLDGRVIGSAVSYQLEVREDYRTYLAFVGREE